MQKQTLRDKLKHIEVDKSEFDVFEAYSNCAIDVMDRILDKCKKHQHRTKKGRLWIDLHDLKQHLKDLRT